MTSTSPFTSAARVWGYQIGFHRSGVWKEIWEDNKNSRYQHSLSKTSQAYNVTKYIDSVKVLQNMPRWARRYVDDLQAIADEMQEVREAVGFGKWAASGLPPRCEAVLAKRADYARREAAAFDAFRKGADRESRQWVELGLDVDRCARASDDELEEGARDLGKSATAAGIPDGWLNELVDSLKSCRASPQYPTPRQLDQLRQTVEEFEKRLEESLARAKHFVSEPLTPKDRSQLLKAKRKLDDEGRYFGESDAVLILFQELKHLTDREVASITLLGPTGSGKSFLAEIVHKVTFQDEKKFARCNAADFMGSDMNIAKGKLNDRARFVATLS